MPVKLLYTVLFGLFAAFHPFHVSVCDIEHDVETEALQISQRIFIDDLEEGLMAFHNLPRVDTYKPEDPNKLDSLIGAYLKARLFIKVDGKEVVLNYLGSELEGDARWAYLEVEGMKSISEAEVTNVILLDTFDDQANIVHFKANEKLRSRRLDRDEKVASFKFD